MKYNLMVANEFGATVVYLCDEDYGVLLWIYRTNPITRRTVDSENFWFAPNWAGFGNKEYHDHREEYIKEAKKLLIKEML